MRVYDCELFRNLCFVLFFFPFAVQADVIFPTDGNQNYYCHWNSEGMTRLRSKNNGSLSFKKVRLGLNKKLNKLRELPPSSARTKKITRLKAALKGVNRCQKGELGLRESKALLPVVAKNLVLAQVELADEIGSILCSVISYDLKESNQFGNTAAFIICDFGGPSGADSYRFELEEVGETESNPKNIVLYQSRFAENSAAPFLDGWLCAEANLFPCANENTQKFSLLINDSVVQFRLIVGERDLFGNLTCVLGC